VYLENVKWHTYNLSAGCSLLLLIMFCLLFVSFYVMADYSNGVCFLIGQYVLTCTYNIDTTSNVV